MDFAKRLRDLRERTGMSQSALAKKSGQSLRSIQNWEQGHRIPKTQGLVALASAFGITIDELLREPATEKRKRK
jgi:transcriptional regulator with XRE-family HTH domain